MLYIHPLQQPSLDASCEKKWYDDLQHLQYEPHQCIYTFCIFLAQIASIWDEQQENEYHQ
jgi:hypothetical protein